MTRARDWVLPCVMCMARVCLANDAAGAAQAYVQGILDGDAPAAMAASHPMLAKRRVAHEYWGAPSRDWLRPITHAELASMIDYLHGSETEAAPPPTVELLSQTQTMAAARVRSRLGLQLLHLTMIDGSWIVVDDAYEIGPHKPAPDRGARQAVFDYARGFYQGDAQKVQDSCHTSLCKREVVRTPTAPDLLRPTTYEELDPLARSYARAYAFDPRRARLEITVLAMGETVGSVRLDGENWTDLIHLALVNDEWRIIDVLTEWRVEE